ncbi:MAG TPA: hypothetical protein VGQ57_01080, partial [Polyangiaceae bacterium]|nr:hypothetical protein [Polyangiaceae bacterium]
EQALELEGYDRKRADVYGLGAVLYDLLVGHAPFTGTPHDVRRGVLGTAPVRSPRARGVEVARDLELIVLRCLEKRPSLRYASAAEIVEELTAFVEGRPPRIAKLGWAERSLRQCVRHPLGAVLASLAIVLVLAAGLVGAWTTGELERTLRNQVTRANAQAARATAGQVLLLLRGFGDALRPCSKEAAIAQHLSNHLGRGDGELVRLLARCAPPATFDSLLALDLDGCPAARTPDPRPLNPDYYEHCFDFRDYYVGAKRLAARRSEWQRLSLGTRGTEPEDVYVARAHRSEGDFEFKFSLAMPIFDAPLGNPDAKCVGYLMATLATDSTIGSYPLSDPHDPGRLGSVVSLRDRERAEALLPLPREFRVLIHEGLPRGEAVRIGSPELARFADRIGAEKPDERQQFRLPKAGDLESSTNFLDPIPHYAGRWLAGFARVGQTDQVVLIQTRYDTITMIEKYLWRVLTCTALILVVGFGAAWLAIVALRKRGWL